MPQPSFCHQLVYWSFLEARLGGNLTAIRRGLLANDKRPMETPTVICRTAPAYVGTLHYGGRAVFNRTGSLVVSTGKRSDLATQLQTEVATSSLSNNIRITRTGSPPPAT